MTTRGDRQWDDPLNVGKNVLSRAVRLGIRTETELEVYVEYSRTTTVKVFGGEVESVASAEPRGLGVRAIDRGRVGYSYTADLSDHGVDKALVEALDNLRAADTDEYQALPAGGADYPVIPDLWRPGVASTSLDRKVDIALAAERAALAARDVDTVETAEYSDEESRIAIISTQGVEVQGEQSFCFAYAVALAGEAGDRQSGLGFTTAREPGELDPVAAGAEAAEKARALVGARPCKTGLYTVVFSRETAAALVGLIVSALSADAIQKGRSVFGGRLGEAIGSEKVTLLDDGLAPGGLGTSPFDAEGVPQQATVLVQNGILRNILHDVYTARKEGPQGSSTGNARRQSYRGLPTVGISNLVVSPGSGSLSDLLGRVGSGLYVEDLSGLHSGVNPVSGEISVGATGRIIEAGRAGQPVREVTIATDFVRMLRSVCDIADDSRWIPLYGSVCTPSIAVAEVAVSGV